MKNTIMAILLAIYSIPAAPVPRSASLTITFSLKENGNRLRGKLPDSYAICEDGYAATIWVEGPYDPDVHCLMKDMERQNIIMTQ